MTWCRGECCLLGKGVLPEAVGREAEPLPGRGQPAGRSADSPPVHEGWFTRHIGD